MKYMSNRLHRELDFIKSKGFVKSYDLSYSSKYTCGVNYILVRNDSRYTYKGTNAYFINETFEVMLDQLEWVKDYIEYKLQVRKETIKKILDEKIN